MCIGSQFTLMSLQGDCPFTISNKLVTVLCFCGWCWTDAGVLMWDGTQGHPASAYSLERSSAVAFQIDSFRT